MNYSRQIAWAVILGILSAAAPSISAQSGVHTDGGGHKMVTPDDLTWVDVPSLPPGAKTEASRSKNRQPTVHPFGYASVYKVTRSLCLAQSLCVVQEQFSCNSTH